jgi:uracil-DNA glycosylase
MGRGSYSPVVAPDGKRGSLPLIELITRWQQQATRIAPPEDTGLLPARGGLPGPAFFPEGLGLQSPTADAPWPKLMAIGHNFGSENYRNEIAPAGREEDKTTWRNLRNLLRDADVPIDSCFMTNWFVGLQPGNKQVGDFLVRPCLRYEADCRELLLEQITTLKPKVILLLGLPVVVRVHEIMSALRPWAAAPNWSAVDNSSIGPVAYGIDVDGTGVRVNVVALLHPSFSPPNQRYRKSGMFSVEKPEVEMVKGALN